LKDHGSLVSSEGSATLKSKGYIGGFEGFNVVDALTNTGDFLGSFLSFFPYDLFAIFVFLLGLLFFVGLVFFGCI